MNKFLIYDELCHILTDYENGEANEIDELREHLDEINTFLRIKGMNQISLDNIWTSESFDENNAWNSNGEILPKNTKLNYYIFGKILWV